MASHGGHETDSGERFQFRTGISSNNDLRRRSKQPTVLCSFGRLHAAIRCTRTFACREAITGSNALVCSQPVTSSRSFATSVYLRKSFSNQPSLTPTIPPGPSRISLTVFKPATRFYWSTGSMVTETSSSDSLAVAQRVRDLMNRHGIGKRQQTAELCRILDLSFSQGHRKLRGNSPWTLSQIKKVAEVFGEPAAQLFGAQSLDPGMVGAIAQEAVFCIGATELACTAWVGTALEAGSRPEFVAYSRLGQWRVARHDGTLYQSAYEVHKIEIYPRRAETDKPTIAVVDDDQAS